MRYVQGMTESTRTAAPANKLAIGALVLGLVALVAAALRIQGLPLIAGAVGVVLAITGYTHSKHHGNGRAMSVLGGVASAVGAYLALFIWPA